MIVNSIICAVKKQAFHFDWSLNLKPIKHQKSAITAVKQFNQDTDHFVKHYVKPPVKAKASSEHKTAMLQLEEPRTQSTTLSELDTATAHNTLFSESTRTSITTDTTTEKLIEATLDLPTTAIDSAPVQDLNTPATNTRSIVAVPQAAYVSRPNIIPTRRFNFDLADAFALFVRAYKVNQSHMKSPIQVPTAASATPLITFPDVTIAEKTVSDLFNDAAEFDFSVVQDTDTPTTEQELTRAQQQPELFGMGGAAIYDNEAFTMHEAATPETQTAKPPASRSPSLATTLFGMLSGLFSSGNQNTSSEKEPPQENTPKSTYADINAQIPPAQDVVLDLGLCTDDTLDDHPLLGGNGELQQIKQTLQPPAVAKEANDVVFNIGFGASTNELPELLGGDAPKPPAEKVASKPLTPDQMV